VSKVPVAIIGAGPYGLSLAAHLAARNVEHRIFGRPMQFWSQVADAGGDRNLRTYCFGTNISTPAPGFSFADYSRPRGLETFEPCSIDHFAAYGHWFQQSNVPWVEPVDVAHVAGRADGFTVELADGQRLDADRVIIAIGLTCFAHVPSAIASLPPALALHTSQITSFAAFEGQDVAVIGAGQSALEAAALLHEAGARPQLLVRKEAIYWMNRVPQSRSLWRRLRSPISALGSGPKAWTLAHFPGAMHRLPDTWRTRLVKKHLPPEGAWWLRERVENRMPVHVGTTIEGASKADDRVSLRLRVANDGCERQLLVDHVVAGTGYDIDVERLAFLDPTLRAAIRRIGRAPMLSATFETSVPGLSIIGPASAMSFGPLFRFVAGAEYTAQAVSTHLASRALSTA
jgi:FAD-dependent urate hydroxylase